MKRLAAPILLLVVSCAEVAEAPLRVQPEEHPKHSSLTPTPDDIVELFREPFSGMAATYTTQSEVSSVRPVNIGKHAVVKITLNNGHNLWAISLDTPLNNDSEAVNYIRSRTNQKLSFFVLRERLLNQTNTLMWFTDIDRINP